MIENPAENVIAETNEKYSLNLKAYFGSYLISFAVLGERFSFWGLQAVMVLFLMQVLSQSEKNAFALVGAFGALSYALSLLGGLLSDKLLGTWKSCIIGLALCLVGNTVLIFSYGFIQLNFGLSCILVGAGLFSPSSNNLIRMLHEKKPDLKESAFLITCIAGNISGALAPLIYGMFGANGLWQDAFLISALLNSFSLLLFFKYSNDFFRLCGPQLYQSNNAKLGSIITSSLIIISLGLLVCINWFNKLIFIGIGPLCVMAVWLYRQLNFNERQRIGFIFLLTIILLLFYIAVFQIYSSLTIFINHYVNRKVMEWEIPVPAFASLQCIFFIFCAPVVDRLLAISRKNGHEPSLLIRIPIGLLISIMGFLLFAFGEWAAQQSGYCKMGWIISGNFFLGLGEVFLYPPILTAIATFSPKRLAGTFMGAFSISLALSSYFSGQLANFITDRWVKGMKIESVLDLGYARISMLLMGVLFVSVMIFSYIQKWYHGQRILIQS
jgi:proton-dependent oligopeptide transporter, POT family